MRPPKSPPEASDSLIAYIILYTVHCVLDSLFQHLQTGSEEGFLHLRDDFGAFLRPTESPTSRTSYRLSHEGLRQDGKSGKFWLGFDDLSLMEPHGAKNTGSSSKSPSNTNCTKGLQSVCVCVCVTLGVIGMLLHLFYRRGPGILLLTWSNKARQQDGLLELATPAYLHFSAFFPHGMRLSPEPHWLQT